MSQIEMQVESLLRRVESLERNVEILQTPFKFKAGDEVEFIEHGRLTTECQAGTVSKGIVVGKPSHQFPIGSDCVNYYEVLVGKTDLQTKQEWELTIELKTV